YIGHIADGTADNYGEAFGTMGDGLADGFVTGSFNNLPAGDYSFFVGGANYAAQLTETGTLPTYGANVTLQAIPEPSAFAALAGVAVLGFATLRRRRR
nr:PEP-CTERM sorting domain-containing protein [Opitutaceae bacterium]